MGTDEIANDGLVRLRPLRTDDLDAHARGCDTLVNKWANEGRVSTSDQRLEWLARNAAAWRHHESVVDLAIELCDTSEHIGVVGIQQRLPCALAR